MSEICWRETDKPDNPCDINLANTRPDEPTETKNAERQQDRK